ncbi:GNAT family N-acetyltransferase [Blastococcus brunescens]|uniref:GNAT family N-acetyltransferase n=1 Tax=Blastococcus brunescens TaxID=1564165 RepID=A0ABZ1AZG9_9ACTN|nr:GNAT family N-acetyltransferase [Blastococcus sp. BMG 8361]WRL63967.1 GNAT family N-acetyltransferase [Blastococcus sp. BMG 8361]
MTWLYVHPDAQRRGVGGHCCAMRWATPTTSAARTPSP